MPRPNFRPKKYQHVISAFQQLSDTIKFCIVCLRIQKRSIFSTLLNTSLTIMSLGSYS